MGLMSTLLMGVFQAVIPFLLYFFITIIYFASISANLGSNHNLATGYSGTPLAFGYFLQTFENGIGNINAPTISYLNSVNHETLLDKIITFLIYIAWFIAQIILLIVLLNFVIALISQYYEDVMNQQVMHTYCMRMTLNHEYNVVHQFKVQIG